MTAVSGVEGRRPVTRLRRLEDERWLAFALLGVAFAAAIASLALVLMGAALGIAFFFLQRKGWTYHRYTALAFLLIWIMIEIDAALSELRRHAGTQFDPDVVEALAACLRQPLLVAA